MRSFIKFTISFLLILFTVIIIMIAFSEFIVDRKSDFKLRTSPKYLVLGHSHPACAFNDSLIDNLVNLSQIGESYYYAYFKTKKIIEQNASIEVVFVEFTNNQINELMNNWTWDVEFMNNLYPTFSPFMSVSDKAILARNNLTGYFNSISLALKNNFSRILGQNYTYSKSIGGYLYLERNKTDSLVGAIKKSHIYSENVRVSECNLKYLTKIINFCEEQGKKVILIRSPLHEKYSGYANESIYQEIRHNRYSSIDYLDFSKFPFKNSEFGDLEHLNHKGASIFSNWFNQLLNRDFLENNNKQDYINEEIKTRMHSTL